MSHSETPFFDDQDPAPDPWEGESPSSDEGEDLLDLAPDEGESDAPQTASPGHSEAPDRPSLSARRRGTRKRVARRRRVFTPEQRLLILDAWRRSKIPATDFAPLLGISPHSLYSWRRRFLESGPAGLQDGCRGAPRGSRLSATAKRAILMMKEVHPEWGCDRIHHALERTDGLRASAGAILKFLKQEGYEVQTTPSRPHAPKISRFERSRPNELWQTDLFTFLLKRQNRRVHLIAFMDDFSRFIVGFGLHASASGAMVREAFEASIARFGAPIECLTDNGTQYVTWRGTSAFAKLCERRGIKQIVASPRRPQTLGKIERFWGSLWRECVEKAVFQDIDDARRRLALWIDGYNFQRVHQGIGGLVPADRFFQAAPDVRAALEKQVAANARELAQHGTPRKPFYLTGRVGDVGISLHAEGERVVMTREDGGREEVDLTAPGRRVQPDQDAVLPDAVSSVLPDVGGGSEESPGAPGTSPFDAALRDLGDLAAELEEPTDE